MTETVQSIAREVEESMDALPDVRDTLREILEAVQSQLHEVDSRARTLIQERPLVALAAAVVVGFALRRLLAFGKG